MVRWRGSDVSDTWRLDHPWASIYSFGMAHRRLAGAVGTVAFGTGFGGMYAAIAAVRDLPAGSTVLDVPCGAGVALQGLRGAEAVRYLAADIAPAMLARTRRTARRLGVAVETVEADVAALPLPDRSVELTLSLTGLHCFPDPRAAVRELARVTSDRIELSWLRSDAGLRYRPLLAVARAVDLVGDSATPDEVGTWLADAGFDATLRVEGSFCYASARRDDPGRSGGVAGV
jgi:SAM-dependent methyltransferase